jgi:hypothetical protein
VDTDGEGVPVPWDWEPERKLIRGLSARLGALVDYVYDVRQRAEARAGLMLDIAASQAGTEERLLEAIGSDERRLRLLEQAIRAAETSRVEEKVHAIGRALASGALAEDDAVIDEVSILIAAIADLEIPHIRVLRLLMQIPLTLGQLGSQLRASPELIQALVAALRRHGLIFDGGILIGGPRDDDPQRDFEPRRQIQITGFGLKLLKYLTEAGVRPERSS